MPEHDDVQRPLVGHKMLGVYPSWPKWRLRIFLSVAVVFGVLAAIKLLGLGSKSESGHEKPQSYEASLHHQFDRIKNLVICGSLYITFLGHSKSCGDQSTAKDEGPKATDWLLVVIGALQFWIYVRQARILSRQAKIASDTLGFVSTQDRPYILIADLATGVHKRTGEEIDGHKQETVAHLVNAGKTPAIIHSIEFDGPYYRRLETTPEYESIYSVHNVAIPDDKPLKFGFPVWDSPKNPTAPLFFYVRVHYADVFGRFWATAFAYRLDWDDGPSRIGGRAFNNDRREEAKPDYWPGEEPLSPPLSYRLRQEMRITWLWLITRRWWPW